jgi:long-subunit fatty acid transport protein
MPRILFNQAPVSPIARDRDNGLVMRPGGERRLNDALGVRDGCTYDEAPIRDGRPGPLSPDADHRAATVGSGYPKAV